MNREGLIALVAEKAAVRPHDDVMLQVLTVLGGAQALGLTSEELGAGMFRAKAWTWFERRGEVALPPLVDPGRGRSGACP